MSIRITSSNLFQKLKDKTYRDIFVAGQIKTGIPFQLRALRSARGNMTQRDLATAAGTKQSVISRIESQGAINMTIQSLLKLASALDVALVVRFEPIDRLIDWVDNLAPEVMSPRQSAEILTEMEAEALAPLRDTASSARSLRAVVSTTTANIQTTLVFDGPQAVPAGESVLGRATSASISMGSLSTDHRAA